ncbi:MAG TPA: histidine kinase [Acidimicrobiales bacterium]
MRVGFGHALREGDLRRIDAAAALALVVGLEVQCWLATGVTVQDQVVTAVAAVLFAAPVAVRRRWPGPALMVASAVLLVQVPLGGQLLVAPLPSELLAVAVLLALAYGAGAWQDGTAGVLSLIASLALVGTTPFVPGAATPPTGIGAIGSSLFYSALMVVPGWFVGRIVRRQSHLGLGFERLADRAEDDRHRHEQAAISEERARISQELQDIISHSVSSMVVQAGGARLLLRRDPERARASIVDIERTGREALADLRRLLGMLRKGDDPTSLCPQPGLALAGGLVDRLGADGLPCTLCMECDLTELTPGIDLVAYRTIEAVLTAALEHAAGAGHVTVRRSALTLELLVTVTRGANEIDPDDLAQGLRAITDRIGLYDGSLQLAEAGGGDVAARVTLPLGVGAVA